MASEWPVLYDDMRDGPHLMKETNFYGLKIKSRNSVSQSFFVARIDSNNEKLFICSLIQQCIQLKAFFNNRQKSTANVFMNNKKSSAALQTEGRETFCI